MVLLDSTRERREIHCAVCKKKLFATVRTVDLGELGRAVWVRMPRGWWRLDGAPLSDLHCRCSGCLKDAGQPAPLPLARCQVCHEPMQRGSGSKLNPAIHRRCQPKPLG